MSNSVFLPAVLLRVFDFQSPPQKTTHAISDENEGE